MIDELIARVKDMYHQLERDEARLERRTVENLKFGIIPDGTALEEGLTDEPSPSAVPPPAAAPPEVSLLDMIAATRPAFPFKPARRPPMPPRPYDPEKEPH